MVVKPNTKELTEAVDLRLNRARSWLRKSRKASSSTPPDLNAQFIFLWIAFNALYGNRRRRDNAPPAHVWRTTSEISDFIRFLESIEHASGGKIATLLSRSPLAVQAGKVLDNPFLDLDCWERWETEGIRDRQQRLTIPWKSRDGHPRTVPVFRQIYTLRNQLLHGAASDDSRRNRESLKHAILVLDGVVDALIPLVEQHQAHIPRLHPVPFPPSTGDSIPFNSLRVRKKKP
ncbi:MAG: hypothetical protein K2Q17_08995 [Nitrospiraceae bacterium]|jgi:hypothetical protein|nr:hypothetical protein [Nitrospiraceae bacterium]